MGPCCVEGCEITPEETFYFEFPTSRTLRRKWLELIPIPGKLLLGTVVCSRHFSTTDYENVRGKVRLKSKVVPSLLLDTKKTPPNDTPPSQPKSPTPTKKEKQKSPSPSPAPAPAKSTSPEREQTRSPIERDRSPIEPARSPTEPARSPTEPAKSPTERAKSPTERARSPTERDRSPIKPQVPRSPSPSKPDTCDSTTVSVPSPVDAEKMIDELQKDALCNKSKKVKKHNGVSSQCLPVVQSAPPAPIVDQKEDIEDMITNYHIKNKVPNPALLADLAPVQPDSGFQDQVPETIEIEDVKEAAPVFIELCVDKDGSAAGRGNEDCLMVLESVQVDVDPSTLLLTQDDDYYRDEEEPKNDRKDDPISLLTSSDEDDVILQEPHIDTVEVSDETDEDDKPLVTLVKKKPTKMKVLKKKSKDKRRFMWSMCDFYCVQCHYTTNDSAEYSNHLSTHSTVLQVCSICSYTSASKSNFARHARNHKVEKKFKCHLCEYKARHKMSLIYHLKSHDPEELNAASSIANFSCKNCNFKSSDKVRNFKHLQTCDGVRRHYCDNCDYVTKKRSDLKRHRTRKHPEMLDDEDMEYVPASNGVKTAVRLVMD